MADWKIDNSQADAAETLPDGTPLYRPQSAEELAKVSQKAATVKVAVSLPYNAIQPFYDQLIELVKKGNATSHTDVEELIAGLSLGCRKCGAFATNTKLLLVTGLLTNMVKCPQCADALATVIYVPVAIRVKCTACSWVDSADVFRQKGSKCPNCGKAVEVPTAAIASAKPWWKFW